MSGTNPEIPDDPPAYSPPTQDFQRQQLQLDQEEQYKLIQQYQQQQYPNQPPPPPQLHQQPQQQAYHYGTYPQPVVMTPPLPGNQSIIVVGGCPACRVGVLEDDFSLLGLCCAIAFFPVGLLCCLALREQRCSNCGAVFG